MAYVRKLALGTLPLNPVTPLIYIARIETYMTHVQQDEVSCILIDGVDGGMA